MLRSNRGKKYAAILAVSLGIAFVAFALIYGLSQQAHYREAAQQDTAKYAKNATYQEEQACRGIPQSNLARCKADSKVEYDQRRANNGREYRDLVAQQISALWTSIMGIAAVTGMLISVIGVWLVYTTFKETKLANAIARQAADAAADDARRSRNALIAADRAIIVVSRASQYLPEGDWTEIGISISNEGKSNAYGFQIFYTLSPEPVFRGKTRFVHNDDRICANGNHLGTRFKIRTPRKFPTYIIGYLTYSTMGDANFKSYFCFRIAALASQNDIGQIVGNQLDRTECEGLPSMT